MFSSQPLVIPEEENEDDLVSRDTSKTAREAKPANLPCQPTNSPHLKIIETPRAYLKHNILVDSQLSDSEDSMIFEVGEKGLQKQISEEYENKDKLALAKLPVRRDDWNLKRSHKYLPLLSTPMQDWIHSSQV